MMHIDVTYNDGTIYRNIMCKAFDYNSVNQILITYPDGIPLEEHCISYHGVLDFEVVCDD